MTHVFDPLPLHTYSIILADPPWRYMWSRSKQESIEAHYNTMSLDDICKMPVKDLAAPTGAALYMWCTWPKLKEGFAVLDAWGFTYKTGFPWYKRLIAKGYWVRQVTEPMLIATIGEISPPDVPNRQVGFINAARSRRHSEKPVEMHHHIDRSFPDVAMRRVELFSRKRRPGWDGWGNEYPTTESGLLRFLNLRKEK